MDTENLQIRTFHASDAPELVEILRRNRQYDYPEVEGPAAMQRVAACDAAIFLVAEQAGRPVGCIKAVYDGSRASIHLLSVHPDVQHGGIGRALVDAVSAECARRGAPSLSVTVTERSAGFWAKQGFTALPVFLMLKESI